MNGPAAHITVACEGDSDLAILERLASEFGIAIAVPHVRGGKAGVTRNLRGFNNAGRFAPWLVLLDLNSDADCAPNLIRHLLPRPAPMMVFRVAVRAAEAWLLADHDRIARFLRVPGTAIAGQPENLADPKGEIVRLAARSRSRAIRDDMIPFPGSSARVGPGYTNRIIEFARDLWHPRAAARRSPSLAGCIRALERLAHRGALP
jgi:hypothetical protein